MSKDLRQPNLLTVTSLAPHVRELNPPDNESLGMNFIEQSTAIIAFATAYLSTIGLEKSKGKRSLPYTNGVLIEKLRGEVAQSIPQVEKLSPEWLHLVGKLFEFIIRLEVYHSTKPKQTYDVTDKQFVQMGNEFLLKSKIMLQKPPQEVWGIDFSSRYLLWCYLKFIGRCSFEIAQNYSNTGFFAKLQILCTSLAAVLGREQASLIKTARR